MLHGSLAARMNGYHLRPYSPWWTLFPPALAAFSSKRADLVHASADYGLFFKRPRVPLVVTVHNYVSDTGMKPYSSRLQYLHYRSDLRLFTQLTLRHADAVVAISRYMADMVSDQCNENNRLRLIYNGVDEKKFVPRKPSRVSGPFKVFYCGNLIRRKRPELLIPLANFLGSGFEIYFTAGLGHYDTLQGKANVDSASLHSVGKVAHADMPRLYQTMDALFMPSVREGFGLCVAEAMSCGLPVVASRDSALPELVSDSKGGCLCDVDDVASVAAAIRRLAESPELVRQMGEYNRVRVEDLFTLDRMVDEYRELFTEVLDRRSHSVVQ